MGNERVGGRSSGFQGIYLVAAVFSGAKKVRRARVRSISSFHDLEFDLKQFLDWGVQVGGLR